MGNFRQGNRSGGFNRGSSFGNNRFDRSERRSNKMFNAVCSKCGERCQLPFKPTGNKPVFCSNCFRQNEGFGNNNSPRSNSQPASTGVSSKQIDEINSKLDKIILILQDLEIITEEDDSEDYEEDEDNEDSEEES
jgi:CxxC-x17-CxxC domain-containing protein